MLVAAAVCPQTPLLVPQIAGGAAGEMADVRGAASDAVNLLGAAKPDLLIVVAPGGEPGARAVRLGGTFRRFGLDLAVGGVGTAEPCVGLLVGRWLLDSYYPVATSREGWEIGPTAALEGWEVGPDTGPGECEAVGRALAARSERVGLLVMGDGSARRTAKAPGYLDERAVPFDDGVSRAFATADAAALAAIDPEAASAVMAAGRAPWQVLAGAVSASGGNGSGQPWRGRLLSYEAPYGVGYFCAFWEPAPRG